MSNKGSAGVPARLELVNIGEIKRREIQFFASQQLLSVGRCLLHHGSITSVRRRR